mmetsp:Transcript_57285/g.186252  ORF Transcript_57285/g.186252 Transcript_57285/m.186252 type:complete len:250 (-) Transcript_57285:28-777(-)
MGARQRLQKSICALPSPSFAAPWLKTAGPPGGADGAQGAIGVGCVEEEALPPPLLLPPSPPSPPPPASRAFSTSTASTTGRAPTRLKKPARLAWRVVVLLLRHTVHSTSTCTRPSSPSFSSACLCLGCVRGFFAGVSVSSSSASTSTSTQPSSPASGAAAAAALSPPLLLPPPPRAARAFAGLLALALADLVGGAGGGVEISAPSQAKQSRSRSFGTVAILTLVTIRPPSARAEVAEESAPQAVCHARS